MELESEHNEKERPQAEKGEKARQMQRSLQNERHSSSKFRVPFIGV